MRPIHCLLSFVLLAAPISANVSLAGTGLSYLVDRTDDDPSARACVTAVANDCSLRGAMIRANQDGSESAISLPDGLFQLTVEGSEEELALTGDLDIRNQQLQLRALPGTHPVIEQVTQDRIFEVHPSAGSVSFIGPLTLLGGEAFVTNNPHRGGSINFVSSRSLTLRDVHMIDGFAADSGGCLEWEAPPTEGFLRMTDVMFTGCETEGEGGAFSLRNDNQPVQLDRVTVKQNIAGHGGGGEIFGGDGPVIIENSTFEHNTAISNSGSGFGGGLRLIDGSFSILESTFANNTAGQTAGSHSEGGGIYIRNSQVAFRNSTLSENRSVTQFAKGADLFLQNSDVDLQFVTVKAHQPVQTTSIVLVSNSTLDVLASVFEGECDGGTINSLGFNVEVPPSGAVTTQCNLTHASDLLVANSLLKPLAGYGGPTPTHELLPATAGTALNVPAALCPDTDQRGADRLSLFCYSGAYEANAQAPGSWIFDDGFESGNTAAWSASLP